MARGPRGGEGGELVEVEVELASSEPDDASQSPGEGERPATSDGDLPPAVSSGRPSRRAMVALLTVAALVGGVVAGVNLAERRAVEQRRAELAAIPGVLQGDLGRPVESAWSVEGAWDWAVAAGELLLLGRYEQAVVVGVDPADGSVRWRHEERSSTGAWCTLMLREQDRRMEVFLGLGVYDHRRTGAQALALLCSDADTLRAVDVRSGGVVGEVPLLSFGTYTVVEDDVVAISRDEDGVPQAVRWSPLTGEVRWTADVSTIAPDRESDEVWGWFVEGTSEAVGVYTDRTLVLDPADGSELPVTDAPRGGGIVVEILPDGATVQVTLGASGEVGAVREKDGTLRFELTGAPYPLDVREGSLVLSRTRAGRLAASHAQTGELMWEREDLSIDRALLAVAGRVLVMWMGKVYALDQETGRTLWEAEVPSSGAGAVAAVSDGTHVLLPALDDGELTHVARRLDDGSEVWRVPLAQGVRAVTHVGSLVLVATPDGLQASRATPFPGQG